MHDKTEDDFCWSVQNILRLALNGQTEIENLTPVENNLPNWLFGFYV